jgi:hypothetical protein
MNRLVRCTTATIFWVFLLSLVPLAATLSMCDYAPPESRIVDLSVLGSFNWVDGAYADDRNRSMSASLVGDYTAMFSSPSFGQDIDVRTEFRADDNGWIASLFGSGSLRSFFPVGTADAGNADAGAADVSNEMALFGVGAIGFALSTRSGIELDLTGGVGTGRFRDVTPLAQAIAIQNALLDLGELLAPVSNETLLDFAQILGVVGPSDDEKVVQLVDRLASTELILGEDLGVRGLLALEDILSSSDETRLCGRDLQARVGVSALILPQLSVATTAIVQARYAAVPDPVSQFDSSAEAKVRVLHPEQMSVQAEVAYARRLPDGWTARAEYRVALDRMWTDAAATVIEHIASANLTTQVFGIVGLSLVGSAQYRTGDEELTLSLAVYMETDLF